VSVAAAVPAGLTRLGMGVVRRHVGLRPNTIQDTAVRTVCNAGCHRDGSGREGGACWSFTWFGLLTTCCMIFTEVCTLSSGSFLVPELAPSRSNHLSASVFCVTSGSQFGSAVLTGALRFEPTVGVLNALHHCSMWQQSGLRRARDTGDGNCCSNWRAPGGWGLVNEMYSTGLKGQWHECRLQLLYSCLVKLNPLPHVCW
jgi:hypothetical protein